MHWCMPLGAHTAQTLHSQWLPTIKGLSSPVNPQSPTLTSDGRDFQAQIYYHQPIDPI